ncbi:hypothetical protein NP233_g96 [Leucocoprinus birnbaumii]|uniref:C2H2-type domain-containing protein n=1 Tax=Leucocoprinus birnbaumii TaxID=56174 RepID=A0AAD5W2Q4_9AGAR|nr:hypothetical protein NP233_g96 [Leucocoprinus birnbaumii]
MTDKGRRGKGTTADEPAASIFDLGVGLFITALTIDLLNNLKLPDIPERIYRKKKDGPRPDIFPILTQFPPHKDITIPGEFMNSELAKCGIRFHSVLKSFFCVSCKYILAPAAILHHLGLKEEETGKKAKKKNTPKRHDVAHRLRSVITEEIKRLKQAMGIPDEPPDVSTLSGQPAFEGLRLYIGALKCKHPGCGKVFANYGSMTNHEGGAHPNLKPKPGSWPTVFAQKYGEGNGGGKMPMNILFEVTVSKERLLELFPPAAVNSEDHPPQYLTDFFRAMEHISSNNPDTTGVSRDMSVWLSKTRWQEHVASQSLGTLRSLTLAPAAGHYPQLNDAVLWIFKEAMAKINKTPTLILRRLSSRDPVHSIKSKPFGTHQNEDQTLKRYASEITKFMAFLMRDKGDYKLHLPLEIQKRVTRLSRRHYSPSPNSVYDYGREIQDLLLQIWTSRWAPDEKNLLGDPTLCYLALSSINNSEAWSHPKYVTGTIAKLIWSIRAVFLLQCHTERHPLADNPPSAAEPSRTGSKANSGRVFGPPSPPPPDETESSRVHTIYEELKEWQSVNKESTFSRLADIQRIASSLAFASAGLPKIAWLNRNFDSFTYLGFRISMSQIHELCWELHSQAWKLFRDEVLLGQTQLLVDYTGAADDWSAKAKGKCFLDHGLNLKRFGDKKLCLIDAIRHSPKLASEFIIGDPLVDLEEVKWNQKRVDKWFAAYHRLQLLILVCAEVMAGSPKRGPELTCLLLRNTALQLRNMVIIGNHVALMCRYSKTRALLGYETDIAHGTDPIIGDFLVQDAIFDISLSTLGYAFGVHDFRHILIGVRRVHCPEFEEAIAGSTKIGQNSSIGGHTNYQACKLIPHFLRLSGRFQAALGIPVTGPQLVSCATVENKEVYQEVAQRTAELIKTPLPSGVFAISTPQNAATLNGPDGIINSGAFVYVLSSHWIKFKVYMLPKELAEIDEDVLQDLYEDKGSVLEKKQRNLINPEDNEVIGENDLDDAHPGQGVNEIDFLEDQNISYASGDEDEGSFFLDCPTSPTLGVKRSRSMLDDEDDRPIKRR